MVFERDEQDAAAWGTIRDLGANVVATLRPPSAEIDDLASAAGMTYLAFLTTDEISILARDASRISEVRAERALAGFYYLDSQVLEGFTTSEAQRQAYSTLNARRLSKNWPAVSNAAVFAWKIAESAPLIEIADRPDLQASACNLFSALSRASGCRSKRVISWR